MGRKARAEIVHGTWNLGGVRLSVVPKGIREAEKLAKQQFDVFSIQEMPRTEAGWTTLCEEGWTFHAHRDPSAWRGCGVCFRTLQWAMLAKRRSSRGVWCKLRRKSDGAIFWVGSAHLTQGATKELHFAEVHEFIGQMPQDRVPVILGVDANTPFSWVCSNDEWMAVAKETKGENMLNRLLEDGIALTAPPASQKSVPTCRPRKQDVQGRHIDVLGGRGVVLRGLGIVVDTHKIVGADHDLVCQHAEVRCGGRGDRRPNTKPKRVCGPLVIPETFNQEVLRDMAGKFTSGYKSVSYQDPADVKDLFSRARASNLTLDWKQAQRARDAARARWKDERIRAATMGDWEAFRASTRKGSTGWEDSFAAIHEAKGLDPLQSVYEHFQGIYQGRRVPPFPHGDVPCSVDFSVEELRDALRKGKNRKATGGDEVSHELLVAINADPEGEARFLAWFNRLLHGHEPLPTDWAAVVMVLLPKCAQPTQAKDLRPICLGSAANKVYARMLLARSMPALAYSGTFQNSGSGRQTLDYLWIVSRLMALDGEWKRGITFLKLDIAKAFDCLDRVKFLERLRDKMGVSEELRSWWEMFRHTEAGLFSTWGECSIQMTSGIRQGSVESPQAFATAMDWVVADVKAKHGWNPRADVYNDLEFAESGFVDDCVLWDGDLANLSTRAGQLLDELALWGLRVNPEKCQLYVSPYVNRRVPVTVGGRELKADDRLDVMGVPFKVGISPKDAMANVFQRAKSKFWAMKHLFLAKTPLAGRMQLMQRVLGGTSLWCVGAFVPDRLKPTSSIVYVAFAVLAMPSSHIRERDGPLFGFGGVGTMLVTGRGLLSGRLFRGLLFSTGTGISNGGGHSRVYFKGLDTRDVSFRD